MIVREEEHSILNHGAAERSAKLILLELRTFGGEIIPCVKIGIAQEFECVSMELIGTGVRENQNLPTAVIAVFGIEAVRENAQLLN